MNTLNICQGKAAQRATVDKLVQDNDKIAYKWKEEIEIHLARAPTVINPELRKFVKIRKVEKVQESIYFIKSLFFSADLVFDEDDESVPKAVSACFDNCNQHVECRSVLFIGNTFLNSICDNDDYLLISFTGGKTELMQTSKRIW